MRLRVHVLVVVAVSLAACGRVSYDPLGGMALDASSDAARDAAVPIATCDPGAEVVPVDAFEASPARPGEVCNLDAVLALDGAVAGLERFEHGATSCTMESCGCIGLDFGAVLRLDSLGIWAAPAADACGQPCRGGECGTGRDINVFTAPTLDAIDASMNGENVDLTSDAITRYELPLSEPTRFVVLCRRSWSRDRDDAVLDYVSAICAPCPVARPGARYETDRAVGEAVEGWWFMGGDRRLSHPPRTRVEPGQTLVFDGELVPGKSGLHASRCALDALAYARGPLLCRVKVSGEIVEVEDQLCGSRRSVEWIADADAALQRFAVDHARYAVEAIDDPDERWTAALDAKRRYLAGELTKKELKPLYDAVQASVDEAREAVLAAVDAVRDAEWHVEQEHHRAREKLEAAKTAVPPARARAWAAEACLHATTPTWEEVHTVARCASNAIAWAGQATTWDERQRASYGSHRLALEERLTALCDSGDVEVPKSPEPSERARPTLDIDWECIRQRPKGAESTPEPGWAIRPLLLQICQDTPEIGEAYTNDRDYLLCVADLSDHGLRVLAGKLDGWVKQSSVRVAFHVGVLATGDVDRSLRLVRTVRVGERKIHETALDTFLSGAYALSPFFIRRSHAHSPSLAPFGRRLVYHEPRSDEASPAAEKPRLGAHTILAAAFRSWPEITRAYTNDGLDYVLCVGPLDDELLANLSVAITRFPRVKALPAKVRLGVIDDVEEGSRVRSVRIGKRRIRSMPLPKFLGGKPLAPRPFYSRAKALGRNELMVASAGSSYLPASSTGTPGISAAAQSRESVRTRYARTMTELMTSHGVVWATAVPAHDSARFEVVLVEGELTAEGLLDLARETMLRAHFKWKHERIRVGLLQIEAGHRAVDLVEQASEDDPGPREVERVPLSSVTDLPLPHPFVDRRVEVRWGNVECRHCGTIFHVEPIADVWNAVCGLCRQVAFLLMQDEPHVAMEEDVAVTCGACRHEYETPGGYRDVLCPHCRVIARSG